MGRLLSLTGIKTGMRTNFCSESEMLASESEEIRNCLNMVVLPGIRSSLLGCDTLSPSNLCSNDSTMYKGYTTSSDQDPAQRLTSAEVGGCVASQIHE